MVGRVFRAVTGQEPCDASSTSSAEDAGRGAQAHDGAQLGGWVAATRGRVPITASLTTAIGRTTPGIASLNSDRAWGAAGPWKIYDMHAIE